MAFILITDNPQGGACRCEGQALDLANLSPKQVEALKQALCISDVASDAPQAIDLASLVGALSDEDKNVVADSLLSPILARLADYVSKTVDPPGKYGVSTTPDGVAHIESNDGGTQLETLLMYMIMSDHGSGEGYRLRIEQLERWLSELQTRVFELEKGNN